MKYSQRMVPLLAVFVSLLSVAAARPLDISGSRQLLEDNACPPQMQRCFTTPYQAQYFCCDSSANLDCSGGPDFTCTKFLEPGKPQVPASLIPGQSTPSPTESSTPSPTSGPPTETTSSPTSPPTGSPTSGPSVEVQNTNPPQTTPPQTTPPVTTPPQTNPPQTNSPTSGPSQEVQNSTPPPTNPPQTNPPETNPPQTNPPATNPPQTNPPVATPGPVTSSSGGGSWRTGYATWYTDPNGADYYRTACFYNHPEQNPPGRYIVALPPHIFGVGPGAGNGPGCDTFWEIKCVGTLKRIADGPYGGNGAAACRTGQSIIVKGGDLCPECDEPRNDICQPEDTPYCPAGPNGYTPGQPGEHLDLALPAWQVIGNNPGLTGIISILFRQVSRVPDSQLGVPF